MAKETHTLGWEATVLNDPEAVFDVALHETRATADAVSSMDRFKQSAWLRTREGADMPPIPIPSAEVAARPLFVSHFH